MKKNYLLGCSLIALFLLFSSCNNNEDEIIQESTEINIEPDFVKNDGSEGIENEEQLLEEEAPLDSDVNSKHYRYRNYTLLKPSDISEDKINGMCGEATTMPLLVGSRKKKVGEIKVMNDDENLYLTFTADQHKYMKKVYLNIGAKGSTPFYSNGFPNLRKFNFKAFPYYFGGTKKATYVIPLSSIDADCFEIIAYSKIYDRISRCLYTSFAYDQSSTQTYSYSYYSGCYYYNEWVRSFEYCKKDCIETESAYSYCSGSACFSEDGFAQWGWSTRLITTSYSWFVIYAKGEDCDREAAEAIGRINVRYNKSAKSATVDYILYDTNSYVFSKTQLYLGGTKYPLNNLGESTVDPVYYPYSHDVTTTAKTDSYFIENIDDGGFYLIGHSVVSQ